MTSTHRDPHTALRARLASTPLPEPGPEQVQRWRAALNGLDRPEQPVRTEPARDRLEPAGRPPSEPPRPRQSGRARSRRWVATVTGLAAAMTALGYLGPLTSAPLSQPLTLSRDQLLSVTPTGQDFGALSDPATRTACLARRATTPPPAPGAVPGGASAAPEPLAGRQVVLDGRPGVLMVLPTDRPGRLRLLVVDPACGATLADDIVGR
ncbi:MAG: hypothetical protein M3Z25_07145 [Actinomycetota bacterium]|nr:hypothetical protein [Actinomycetota bacterium]